MRTGARDPLDALVDFKVESSNGMSIRIFNNKYHGYVRLRPGEKFPPPKRPGKSFFRMLMERRLPQALPQGFPSPMTVDNDGSFFVDEEEDDEDDDLGAENGDIEDDDGDEDNIEHDFEPDGVNFEKIQTFVSAFPFFFFFFFFFFYYLSILNIIAKTTKKNHN